jgi:sulfur-carrier protein
LENDRVSVKLLYFAWVREKVGKAEEIVDLPADLATVADLVAWLKGRGPEYAEAFARTGVVRVAVDKKHVQPAAPIAGAREIALFPPVTGG